MSNKRSKQKLTNNRRVFIQNGLTLGVSALLGASFLDSCISPEVKSNDEKVKLLTTDGRVVEIDKSQIKPFSHHGVSGKEARHGIPGRKFVMVIDLSKCSNARECVKSCQKMHHLPTDVEWIKVLYMKDSKRTDPYWMPKPCFHCDNPPCVSLCPVGATYKRTDGCVLVDNTKCIGCKFCMTGCPYSARVFIWGKVELTEEEKAIKYSPETGIPRVHGTVSKCDFCPDSAREGRLPDCVLACPNGVIYYGDLNEDIISNGNEVVRFSQMIKDKGGYQYAAELGTEPSVYYLPAVDRMFPAEKGFKNIPEKEIEVIEKSMIDNNSPV